MEEFLSDAGFVLVITGLLAATLTYSYIGSCSDASYREFHGNECDIYTPIFYAGVVVGVMGFVMVSVTVLKRKRPKPPERTDKERN